MRQTSKLLVRLAVVILAAGMLGLVSAPGASAATVSRKQNVKNAQEALKDKGYYSGKIDGIAGPQTRAAIRKYQKAEGLDTTGYLDTSTASKLGVQQESAEAEFKSSARQAKQGTTSAGHAIENGRVVEAGKDFGKGVGRAGKDVGRGVKKAVKHATSTGPSK